MSYPPVRYTADAPAVTAFVRPAGAPPDLVTPASEVTYLATGGDLGAYRYVMTGPGGPDPHFHRTISESFYVLSGTVQLYDGTHWVDGGPGDFLHVPVGGVHAFRNASGATAEMLLLFTPGAPREAYFEALAAMQAEGRRLSPEERTAFLAEHDQYDA